MKYGNIQKAVFLSRPNRFIARIEIEGREEICHVKNTGRCRELLVPGAEIYVAYKDEAHRRTKYDLITVRKGRHLINMDSQAPNHIFREWLETGLFFGPMCNLRAEAVFASSRFDFFLKTESDHIFIETKGVTLEEQGRAMFPDAPTERGVKHLKELMQCVREGYRACVFFIIQMEDIQSFQPNWHTHAAFGQTLTEAFDHGVEIYALNCRVTENTVEADRFIPVILGEGASE